ncbi:MAG: tetratricopeptide repeat protein [Spirochaetaceae bacterium]|nr:tetratricopeptide repeat protein [Spirochaetaceae bacterium]
MNLFEQSNAFSGEDTATEDMKFEAQDITWDAWDASSSATRKRLANKALAIDPYCTDAYNVLAFEYRSNPKKREYYEKALKSFYLRNDKHFFEENKGHFWGILETRPFMRAMEGYGEVLREEGDIVKAIEIYEYLLELNPNDNQGIRYGLLNWYLSIDYLEKAKKLMETYDEDTAFMLFNSLLYGIKSGESESVLEKKYRMAVKANKYVVPFLFGEIEEPEYLSSHYALGSEEEAFLYVYEMKIVWIIEDKLETLRKFRKKRKK